MGFAAGPDLGASLNATYVIGRPSYATWSAELRATSLFLDNTEFNHLDDTGDPGQWSQLQLGLRMALAPQERTHFVGRFGATVLDVGDHVDILSVPGTYYGGYVGVGFETRITPRITVGPDLTVMAVIGDGNNDDLSLVPQLNWTVSYTFGGCVPCDSGCNEHRDLYIGAHASAGPGVGAGLTLGQVFQRNSNAVWSFELRADKQTIDGVFGGNDPDAAYSQVLAGAKASFGPCARTHFVARAGFTAFKATGTNDFLDDATTYWGGYAGIGFDWDLGYRWTTGPEATVLIGAADKGGATAVLPQLGWHLTFWL